MTPPTLAPATITRKHDDFDGVDYWLVTVEFEPRADLDRLDAYAWSVGRVTARNSRSLAERLKKAIDAGVVVKPHTPFTDTVGHRGWHTRTTILGRQMNADLRRLGF